MAYWTTDITKCNDNGLLTNDGKCIIWLNEYCFYDDRKTNKTATKKREAKEK